MGELRGYVCDGGCGATTMLERAHESVARNGWFHLFGPDGWPTLYACSAACLIRAVEHRGGRTLGRELPA